MGLPHFWVAGNGILIVRSYQKAGFDLHIFIYAQSEVTGVYRRDKEHREFTIEIGTHLQQ